MLLDGFEPALGDSFNLFDFGTVAGEFHTLNLPVLSSGLEWETGALHSTGTLMVIPEPARLSLLAVGGLLLMRRRR